jgi:hypothetical protein
MTNLFIFLYRLKINQDSHEFILEIGTVANRTVQRDLMGITIMLIDRYLNNMWTVSKTGSAKYIGK